MTLKLRLSGQHKCANAGQLSVSLARRTRRGATAARAHCSNWFPSSIHWKQDHSHDRNALSQQWRKSEQQDRTAAFFTSAILACITSMQTCGIADARVVTEKLMQQDQASQTSISAGFDPGAAAAARGTVVSGSSSSSSRSKQSSVASAAADALQQLAAAQDASKAGDYQAALAKYSQVVQQHPDLALAEYARLGRALTLYEVGDVSKSIIALEDQEISMRGYPEVHAALAAVLYAERPEQRLRAEQQFDIAVEFDKHFQDVQWVAENKHWGPRLQGALQKFLLLQ